MPTMIKDGSGKGYLAKVDSENLLRASVNIVSRLSHVSHETNRAYSIYGKRNFNAGNTNEGILYFEYTGDYDFHIDSLTVSGNGTNNKVELFTDSTYTSGGTSVSPVNLNRNSLRTIDANSYTGETDLVVTEGNNEILDARFGIDTVTINLEGGLLLGKNKNIYILGEVASAGDKIRVTLLGYEDIVIT